MRHAAPLTYARAVPTGVEVQAEAWGPTAQVHGAVGMLIDARGCAVPRRGYDWADTVLMNELAVRGGRGWFLLDAAAASRPGVAERIAAARALGADVFDVPCGGMTAVLAEHAGLRCDARAHASAREAVVVVGVRVGITHTTGGLLPDTQGRVIDAAGRPVPGMHVAGVDAGGLAGRGYVSGLAQALVLGRAAADSIIG